MSRRRNIQSSCNEYNHRVGVKQRGSANNTAGLSPKEIDKIIQLQQMEPLNIQSSKRKQRKIEESAESRENIKRLVANSPDSSQSFATKVIRKSLQPLSFDSSAIQSLQTNQMQNPVVIAESKTNTKQTWNTDKTVIKLKAHQITKEINPKQSVVNKAVKNNKTHLRDLIVIKDFGNGEILASSKE